MIQVKSRFEISDNEYHYTAGYYTENKWIDNDTFIAVRSKAPECLKSKGEVQLVKISVSTGEKTVLCNDVIGFVSHVVHGTNIYYTSGKKIKWIDANTGETKTIYEDIFFSDDEKMNLIAPEITNDGKYISVFMIDKEKVTSFIVIDIEAGTAKILCKKRFSDPFEMANHGMICPTDSQIMFFSHEGDTRYISNRLWIYNAKTDEMYNVAKQKLDENGNLGDCFGHESWSPDGKGVYFVKYPVSPVPPRGICYVDINTREISLLYSGFPYWHVGVSENNKYLLSDTVRENWRSEVIIIDRTDDSEICIDNVHVGNHPAHPHPQMSLDNKTVIYTAINDDGRTCIKGVILD